MIRSPEYRVEYDKELVPRVPAKPAVAFSLIELLVVIVVLALLAAMLLPALAHSRDSARKTSCVNNLRQFGIAADMYSVDSGRFPTILEWLYSRPAAPQPDVATGQLFPYLKTKAVYLCPLKQAENDSLPPGSGTPRSDHSYSINCMTCHTRDLSACLTPAKTVFFVETTYFVPSIAGGISGPIPVYPPESFNPFVPTYPHRDRGNFLMIDGHVQQMTRKEMNDAAGSSDFWYPNDQRGTQGAP